MLCSLRRPCLHSRFARCTHDVRASETSFRLGNRASRVERYPSSRLGLADSPASLWVYLLLLVLFLAISQKALGQTMTLSAPVSSSLSVDNLAVVFSISGESGGISNVRLVMTYTSGLSTASIGSSWTITMRSNSATQSFTFNPSTATSSALFSSVSPATNPPDGTYSVRAQYTRVSTSATVLSNTATNVSVDTGAIPPVFTFSPSVTIDTTTDVISLSGMTAFTLDPTTDVVTLVNHGLATDAPVTVTGTNLSSSTTYYVSVVDRNSFKLATTSGGSTFADLTGQTGSLSPACHLLSNGDAITVSGTDLSSTDTYYVSVVDANSLKLTTTQGGATFVDFATAASPTITYPTMTGDIRTLGTNTASFLYKFGEAYAAGSAKLTFTGHTTVTVTLVNLVRTGRISFDRTNISGPGIASSTATSLPDDTYTVSLTYRDSSNHNSTAATLLYMTYDAGTLAPTFTSLVDNATIGDGSIIPYDLPEAPYGGTVKLTFSNGAVTTVIPLTNAMSGSFTYNRSLHAATIPTGTYTVTLSYQDTLGNIAATKSVTGVAVTVAPFSTTDDTDGDGLNDAAEVTLAALGFDWQVAQPAMVTAFLNAGLYTQAQYNSNRSAGQTDVTSNPSAYSLYSLSQLQNLQVGIPVITKDTVSGKWKLTLGLQKSTDLTNYTAFPFVPSGTTINGSGEVEFLFTVPEDSAFFRVTAF
ncbi:MAG TPA: hypothetical protein PLN52_23725 [Opitutaceae bacterium]|nr:hypothetical protein [Opitutaceae bacterium]